MSNILILDDDPKIQLLLQELVLSLDHAPTAAGTLADGMELAKANEFDVVLLDLDFPEGNGLQILPDLLRLPNAPEVIIITGTGDTKGAEIAFKYGAWDYVKKPFNISEVSLHISRAIQYHLEKSPIRIPVSLKRDNIIGKSKKIIKCLDELAVAASADSSALLNGETGTGKELFARALHENSRQAAGRFIAVDCGALPDTLMESLLFGHEKGAFTGADRHKEGLIAQADGGTLFFDEIGELALSSQKVLLRTLQEHSVRPLGGNREMPVNFRLVAATHRDLEQMVKEKTFREDLLFRIRAIEIKLPPLRDRVVDIPDIAFHTLRMLAARNGTDSKGMSAEFIEVLGKYPWPGNVRELISAVAHSFANAGPDPILVPKHFPPKYRAALLDLDGQCPSGGRDDSGCTACAECEITTWADYKTSMEKDYLRRLLETAGGDWTSACRLSGLSRSRIYELLGKHRLTMSAYARGSRSK